MELHGPVRGQLRIVDIVLNKPPKPCVLMLWRLGFANTYEISATRALWLVLNYTHRLGRPEIGGDTVLTWMLPKQ